MTLSRTRKRRNLVLMLVLLAVVAAIFVLSFLHLERETRVDADARQLAPTITQQ
jgi:hypothetical protein